MVELCSTELTMAFAYDSNEFVYGADIAALARSGARELWLKPMYLMGPSSGLHYLTGWDPVWAWECVCARSKALVRETEDPTSIHEWTNQLSKTDLQNLRNGIYDLEYQQVNVQNKAEFLINPSLLYDLAVSTSSTDYHKWQTLEDDFPGITTRNHDPNNTHSYMDALDNDDTLRKSFWYDGVWRRLSQLQTMRMEFFEKIPSPITSEMTIETIDPGYPGSWSMSYSPYVGALFNHIAHYKFSSGGTPEWHEGRFVLSGHDTYFDYIPTPQPSKPQDQRVWKIGDEYAVIRLRWSYISKTGSTYSRETNDKFVFVNLYERYIDYDGLPSVLPEIRAAAGVSRDPRIDPDITYIEALRDLGGDASEYLTIEVADYFVLAKMSKTAVTFSF